MAKIQELEASKDIQLVRIFDTLDSTLFKNIEFMIAGGAVRKAYIGTDLGRSDIDIFFTNEDSYADARIRLKQVTEKVYSNENCCGSNLDRNTFNLGLDNARIQLIKKKFYPDFNSLFDDFDFTICQFGYLNGKFLVSDKAIEDNDRKILRFNNEGLGNVTTMNRLYKYMCRGFTPTHEVIRNTVVNSDCSLAPWSVSLMDLEEEYGLL